MPVQPPASFAAFDPDVWDRFAYGVARQVEIALTRLSNGDPLPSRITTGGATVRESGQQAQYRALVNGLARTFGMPTEYAQVAAWASVANADATTRSLSTVIDGTPAEVQAAIRGLPVGAPLSSVVVPNPATAVAIATVTQRGIIKGAVGLTERIPGLIGEIVQTGTISGSSVQQIGLAIRQQVGGYTRSHAEMIARTQTADAYNLVSQTSFLANSQVTHWEWVTAVDERTCPTCLSLDGQVFRQEVEPDGHNNCRCVMIPIDGPPTVTSNGYNANGTRIRNGREVPLDWKANQAAARDLLPKSWAADGVDTTRLLGWKTNPDWRPTATLVRPGADRTGIISLAAKRSTPATFLATG